MSTPATDPLARTTIPNDHAAQAWVVKIISVDEAHGTCTINSNDGGGDTPEVPYYGGTPIAGDQLIAFMFDHQLGVVTPGAAVSGIWGVDWLAKSGNDPLAGRNIYVDSAGQIRARPQELSANQGSAMLDGNTAPGGWPNGQMVLQVTVATSATWPGAVSGTVLNIRRPGEQDDAAIVQQLFFRTGNQTTAGQMIMYRNATGTPSVWSPWVPIYSGSPPRAARMKSTSQPLTTLNTYYLITFDTDYANGSGVAYNAGTFTIQEAGVYQINAQIHVQVAGSTNITMSVNRNSASVLGSMSMTMLPNQMITYSTAWRFDAGDDVGLYLRSNVAGAIAYGSGVHYSRIDITKISN